MTHSFTNLL